MGTDIEALLLLLCWSHPLLLDFFRIGASALDRSEWKDRWRQQTTAYDLHR
jgi:hypothetical protein